MLGLALSGFAEVLDTAYRGRLGRLVGTARSTEPICETLPARRHLTSLRRLSFRRRNGSIQGVIRSPVVRQ